MLRSAPEVRAVQRLLGARLKEMRELQKLRVIEVAAALGIEPGTVYAVERGDHPPSFTLFLDFAKLYKVDEADLLTWPGTDSRHDLREVVRATPNGELDELREVWEEVVDPAAKNRPR